MAMHSVEGFRPRKLFLKTMKGDAGSAEELYARYHNTEIFNSILLGGYKSRVKNMIARAGVNMLGEFY